MSQFGLYSVNFQLCNKNIFFITSMKNCRWHFNIIFPQNILNIYFQHLVIVRQILLTILFLLSWAGSQNQSQRLKAMEKLREFKCRVLISTDLVMMTYPTCTMSSHFHCLCKTVFIHYHFHHQPHSQVLSPTHRDV